MGSRPIRSDGWPGQSPTDDDRQISSEDRRSVKLRVRPPPAGTHRCHRAITWTVFGAGRKRFLHESPPRLRTFNFGMVLLLVLSIGLVLT